MKYYIFRHDWKLNLLKSEDSFEPYVGKPMNFGKKMENFPKIVLNFNSNQIPDSIPNVNNYIVFNQKIISVLKDVGVDYIQYFDVDVEDNTRKIISNNYKCLNILKIIDAIDFENSELKWTNLDEGETEEDRFVLGVIDLRLNYSKINNEPLFRLHRIENLLVFREDLAQAILDKGCTGLEFYQAEGYSS